MGHTCQCQIHQNRRLQFSAQVYKHVVVFVCIRLAKMMFPSRFSKMVYQATLPWWSARPRIFKRYLDLLHRQPLATNFATSFALAGAGDVIRQRAEKKQELDRVRFYSMASFGGAYTAFIFPLWFRAYDRVMPLILPKSWLTNTFKYALALTTADNFVHAPFGYLPCFYMYVGFWQGQSWQAITGAFKSDIVHATLMHAVVWVPIMTLVFGYIPKHLGLVMISVANLGWNVFMSALSQSGAEMERVQDQEKH